MSTGTATSASGGVSLSGLLLVAFVVLKLVGVIDWPWIWVLAPLWIPAVLAVVALVLVFAFVGRS